jgi:hypothetical protein
MVFAASDARATKGDFPLFLAERAPSGRGEHADSGFENPLLSGGVDRRVLFFDG